LSVNFDRARVVGRRSLQPQHGQAELLLLPPLAALADVGGIVLAIGIAFVDQLAVAADAGDLDDVHRRQRRVQLQQAADRRSGPGQRRPVHPVDLPRRLHVEQLGEGMPLDLVAPLAQSGAKIASRAAPLIQQILLFASLIHRGTRLA
jgi:hypothetical protein